MKSVVHGIKWSLGLVLASFFSISYLLTPLYVISASLTLIDVIRSYLQKGTEVNVIELFYAMPMIVSIVLPPLQAQWVIATLLKPLLTYFQFEAIKEISDDELRVLVQKNNKKFIVAAQPHGVISFCGFCLFIHEDDDLRNINTAVASVLLKTPILKHVLGIFGLVSASASNLKRHFKKQGFHGCIVIYIGGLAELFKSSRREERLYLSKRKGFIKLALREGVDVLPIYLFGNTSVLSVLKYGPLAALSRKLQVSLTYFWGKWLLPIPRDDKCLFVRGKPLGLPHIAEPTQEEIDFWHKKYCDEVRRLFESYKEKVPQYKHKQLFID